MEARKKAKGEDTQEPTKLGSDLSGDEKVVFDYMYQQNRPYSAQNVFDNLRGSVKKAQCGKVLDSLVSKRKLQDKDFGKTKIYLINQALLPEVDEAEIQNMDKEIETQRTQVEELNTELKTLNNQLSQLQKALTVEELQKKVEELSLENQNLTQQIQTYKEAGCVTEEAKNSALEKLKKAEQEEKNRRRICMELINTIADMAEMKPDKVKEMIEIEEP